MKNEKSGKFDEIYDASTNDSVKKFRYHLEQQLRNISLKGRDIIEVGCGKGFVSLYIALFCGARKIVALDESEGIGSEKGVLGFLEKTVEDLNIRNTKVVKSDIMKTSFPDGSFDIIIANNALHHIVRTGKYILNDITTKNEWITLFRELKRLLKANGILILGEFSRKIIWRYIKLRYRQIDWELHPTLREWLLVINLAGFKKIRFKYTVPYKLRTLESLFSNPMASFFMNSTFNIYAQK